MLLVQAFWASLPAPLPVHVTVGISGQLPGCLLPPSQQQAPDSQQPRREAEEEAMVAHPIPQLDRSGVLWSRLLAAVAATPGAGVLS